MPRIMFARVRCCSSIAAIALGCMALPAPTLAQNTGQTAAPAAATAAAAAANTAAGNRRGGGGGDNGQRPADPGVRGGDPGVGGPLSGLSAEELAFFEASKDFFAEVEDVAAGLGPRLNLDGCAACHVHPAMGGTSPAVNPQVAFATAEGQKNVVPPFIAENGPIREARFVRNRDGSPDGSVHALFVITGRADAAGCNIQQPNFAAELARNNVVFRIPTPVFGLGLVEAVPDGTLIANLASDAQLKRSLGVSGRLNRNGNDNTVTRFGWKAQNPSLLLFSGEAYNVEQGITNEMFTQERETDPNCQFAPIPNSATPLVAEEDTGSPSANFQSDMAMFAAFMRLTAPPAPAADPAAATAQSTTPATAATPTSVLASAAGTAVTAAATPDASAATVARGRQVFENVGCAACHTVSLKTGKSSLTGQSDVTINPFSDFALHDMGDGLADGISQGLANGREFRTAPLWGVGQRIFLLHDGRTSDIVEAIEQHASRGSEANGVIRNYNLLALTDKQALVNFLRSL